MTKIAMTMNDKDDKKYYTSTTNHAL